MDFRRLRGVRADRCAAARASFAADTGADAQRRHLCRARHRHHASRLGHRRIGRRHPRRLFRPQTHDDALHPVLRPAHGPDRVQHQPCDADRHAVSDRACHRRRMEHRHRLGRRILARPRPPQRPRPFAIGLRRRLRARRDRLAGAQPNPPLGRRHLASDFPCRRPAGLLRVLSDARARRIRTLAFRRARAPLGSRGRRKRRGRAGRETSLHARRRSSARRKRGGASGSPS